MQMAITNEAHTLDAPQKRGLDGRFPEAGAAWEKWRRGHSNRTVETINLVPRLAPKHKRCPSIAKGRAQRGRVQRMSQSCNMAAHQWPPGGRGLLYSGTAASLLKHVANICYAKVTFMLNAMPWGRRGQEGEAERIGWTHISVSIMLIGLTTRCVLVLPCLPEI